MSDLNEYLNEQLKNEDFRKEYTRDSVKFSLIQELMKFRIENKLTQEDLAKKVGLKTSELLKFERGDYNPTLDLLYKMADVLGKELVIELK